MRYRWCSFFPMPHLSIPGRIFQTLPSEQAEKLPISQHLGRQPRLQWPSSPTQSIAMSTKRLSWVGLAHWKSVSYTPARQMFLRHTPGYIKCLLKINKWLPLPSAWKLSPWCVLQPAPQTLCLCHPPAFPTPPSPPLAALSLWQSRNIPGTCRPQLCPGLSLCLAHSFLSYRQTHILRLFKPFPRQRPLSWQSSLCKRHKPPSSSCEYPTAWSCITTSHITLVIYQPFPPFGKWGDRDLRVGCRGHRACSAHMLCANGRKNRGVNAVSFPRGPVTPGFVFPRRSSPGEWLTNTLSHGKEKWFTRVHWHVETTEFTAVLSAPSSEANWGNKVTARAVSFPLPLLQVNFYFIFNVRN